ncbi:hypothetical protein ACSHWB_03160 [Lentzea sp. HUAS TT2]|uniref:hypothetical protein n=1 Tax=Lentzea sp. HUAS TT2 TaxID=3447454 RepID=UPI003F6E7298
MLTEVKVNAWPAGNRHHDLVVELDQAERDPLIPRSFRQPSVDNGRMNISGQAEGLPRST